MVLYCCYVALYVSIIFIDIHAKAYYPFPDSSVTVALREDCSQASEVGM